MAKIDSPKEKDQKGFRYSEIPGPITNALNTYFLVSTIKGIIWLVKTPIKWIIKKVK
jgi:hypothetical protein